VHGRCKPFVIKVPGRIRTRIPSPVLAASLLSPGETALQEKAIPMQAVGNGFPVIVHEPRFLKISKNQPERITINQRKSQGWCGKAYPFKAATQKHPGGGSNLSLLLYQRFLHFPEAPLDKTW
jgi:hypothetical protein